MVIDWIWPRLWCRRLCPLGALYGLLGRFAPVGVKVKRSDEACKPCGQCTLHCPLGIRIVEDYVSKEKAGVTHPDCTRCGACLDVCPRGMLVMGVRLPTDSQ